MRSHEGEGAKQFKIGFRGYRRDTVDEYVERLHGWLMDSESRADNAVETATVAVGERASEILRAALEVGEKARLEAEDVKAAAVHNAQAEADRMMADAHREIAALQQSIDSLIVRRANVVSELGRLQKYLADAAPDRARGDSGPDEFEGVEQAMTAEPDVAVALGNGDRPLPKSA
ncbi:MAG TPA: hypothetical protein VN768_00445 [Acidimicrobiales bacterium]|nr:hypothetical protein [Acidimicrobiales bacterium]